MARKLKKKKYIPEEEVKPRKLKRKFKGKRLTEKAQAIKDSKNNTGRKKRKMYKKAKCAFHDISGKRCTRNAVGKSTLCEKHGGIRVDINNTYDPIDTKALVLSDHNALFQPEAHPILYIELSQDGKSDAEIAAMMGVGVNTLKTWSETYRAMSVAFEVGKAMQEAWWLRKGKSGLDSRYFNTTLYKFLTGNKLGYSDKIETKTHSTHIHGVLMVPDAVTPDQWEAEYVDGEVIDTSETVEDEGDK